VKSWCPDLRDFLKMSALFGCQEVRDVDHQRGFREEVNRVWRVCATVIHQRGLLRAALNNASQKGD
jgi:hypothetical protein